MVDWIMYGKIQEMKRTGLNKSQTSRHLGIDYKTVLKYWDMSPDMSAAQIYDWIRERTCLETL